ATPIISRHDCPFTLQLIAKTKQAWAERTLEVPACTLAFACRLQESCVSSLSALLCSLARRQRLRRQLPFLLRNRSSMSKQTGGIVGIGAGICVSAGQEAPAACACENAKRNQLQFGP